ncbi:hypothetical protein AAFC00_004310 [Neodothiora populina]|uniref:GH16 domain-containing protein n=1 Tax=Neodothiora populina TaxID=2781224 RepID=A0ABR3PJL6_9PEZI
MPSSSLVLGVGIAALSAFAPRSFAQTYTYTLQDTYSGSSFYDQFNFISDSDPTHGFVQYLDQSTAASTGLISVVDGVARWGTDSTNIYSNTSTGRPSIRLEGKTNYNHGLFIADIKHMPGSICGAWPAFWTLGDATWPSHGELDIIEGVNKGTNNQISAHTGDNCSMAFTGQSGWTYTTDCALSTGGATGCGVGASQSNTYGDGFNSIGGGVYAMQWTSAFIKVWFFPRGSIPASITAGTPDYTTFGTPTANFDGAGCDIDGHFANHRIIFDLTFCGDWAGSVYSSSGCPLASDGSNGCVNYVGNNPSAFTGAYWEVDSIKVYSESVSASPSSSSVSSSASSSSSFSSFSSSLSSISSSSSLSSSATSSRSSSASLSSSIVPSSLLSSTSPATSSATVTSTISRSSSSASVSLTSTSKASSTSSATTSTVKSSTVTSSSKAATSSTTLISTSKASSTISSTTTKASSTSVAPTTLKTSTTTSTKTSTTTSTSAATATPTTKTAVCPADNNKILVSNNKRFLIECSANRNGGDLKSVTVTSSGGLASCIQTCATTTGCVDVVLSGTTCYLKKTLTTAAKSTTANGARLLT